VPAPDAADVDALLEEARAAGRADAFSVLRERWRDAYVEAATTAPAEGTAWWVYGVVEEPVTVDGAGVAGAAVELVSAHGLHAIVSQVPLGEFADEPLRRHLEDLAWVERVARAHEAVLETVMARATVVPLRLCTICLTRERVADLVAAQAGDLAGALDRLRGRSEWGVKLFATPQSDDDAIGADDGAAYLERKRRARSERELVFERVEHVHEALAAVAAAAVVNPAQHREAHGRDADMLLNGAYLVDDARAGELRAIAEHHGAELTGPWPPYNFVSA
jgi:hypothetical protein